MSGFQQVILVVAVVVGCVCVMAEPTSAHLPGGPSDKEAYFETSDGVDFEFRSVGASFLVDAMFEVDFYLIIRANILENKE